MKRILITGATGQIGTALTLERPKGASDLEKRFLGPFQERVFGDYPDLEYELARMSDSLPDNIRVIEFYFPPGKYLNNPKIQQNYISTNYTHVVRDMLDRKINVLAQLVAQFDWKQNLLVLGALNLPLGSDGTEYGGIESPVDGLYYSSGPSVFAQLAWYF